VYPDQHFAWDKYLLIFSTLAFGEGTALAVESRGISIRRSLIWFTRFASCGDWRDRSVGIGMTSSGAAFRAVRGTDPSTPFPDEGAVRCQTEAVPFFKPLDGLGDGKEKRAHSSAG
jgi:hypothetical protein